MNTPSSASQLFGLIVFSSGSYVLHCGFRWIHAQAEKAWEENNPLPHQRLIRALGRFLRWMGSFK